MLAFGVAQLRLRTTDQWQTPGSGTRKCISILDVGIYTAFVGIVITHAKVTAKFDSWILDYGGLSLPTSLAIWLHTRHRLTPIVAMVWHYAISIGWAFCLGFIYRQQRNSINLNYPTKLQLSPISDAVEYATEMLELGVATSSIYFAVTTVVVLLARRLKQPRSANPSDLETAG